MAFCEDVAMAVKIEVESDEETEASWTRQGQSIYQDAKQNSTEDGTDHKHHEIDSSKSLANATMSEPTKTAYTCHWIKTKLEEGSEASITSDQIHPNQSGQNFLNQSNKSEQQDRKQKPDSIFNSSPLKDHFDRRKSSDSSLFCPPKYNFDHSENKPRTNIPEVKFEPVDVAESSSHTKTDDFKVYLSSDFRTSPVKLNSSNTIGTESDEENSDAEENLTVAFVNNVKAEPVDENDDSDDLTDTEMDDIEMSALGDHGNQNLNKPLPAFVSIPLLGSDPFQGGSTPGQLIGSIPDQVIGPDPGHPVEANPANALGFHSGQVVGSYPAQSSEFHDKNLGFIPDQFLGTHLGQSVEASAKQFVDLMLDPSSASQPVKPSTSDSTTAKPYVCDVCGKGFSQQPKLKAHKLIHTGENPLMCDVCYKPFSWPSELRLHRISHTGLKPFQCQLCQKGFTQASTLKRHMLIHTGTKQFMCEVCHRCFTQASTLKSHRLVHTTIRSKPKKPKKVPETTERQLVNMGEKRFACDECEKTFALACQLKSHKVVHTDERPFSCDECGQSFRKAGHLKTHKIIHTGQKNFECNVCSKTFALAGNLKRHLKTHSNKPTSPKPKLQILIGKRK